MGMKRGFTIIELLVVIVIGVLLLLVSGLFRPAERLQTLELERATELVINELLRARVDAQTGNRDSDWGIWFTTQSLTRFAGTSYANRNPAYDITNTIDPPITFGGTQEVIFQRPHATLTSLEAVTITNGTRTNTITISTAGVLNTE
jgi:prepilin-type N-terminal cleavage/methylation domain-containing protein